MLKLILAIDENNLVGSTTGKFGLAWHYPEDLKFYKRMTTNQICVMGRTTFECIGRPLPNRTTIVLSRNKDYQIDGVEVVNDIDYILKLSEQQDILICGGVQIFELFINMADVIYLTRIHATHVGDVYYNQLNLQNFELKQSELGENQVLEFQEWRRK